MIISLAQGHAKAIKIVAELLMSESNAARMIVISWTCPIVPVVSMTVAITYFPMSDLYSIATIA